MMTFGLPALGQVRTPPKPNLDVPKGVPVERQPSGVKSPNPAGGTSPPARFTKS